MEGFGRSAIFFPGTGIPQPTSTRIRAFYLEMRSLPRAPADFDHRGNFALTHYAQNYLGSHEFKFGVQFQDSSVRDEYSINGGFIYYSYYDYDTYLELALFLPSGHEQVQWRH